MLAGVLVWAPIGCWVGGLLALLRGAIELAAAHRRLGTATEEESAILLWETARVLPRLVWPAAVAGILAAALGFKLGGVRRGRTAALVLAAAAAGVSVVGEAFASGRLAWRGQLAIDDLAVALVLASSAGLLASSVADAGARIVGPLEDAPLALRPWLGGSGLAIGALVAGVLVVLPPSLVPAPGREVSIPVRDLVLEPGGIEFSPPLADARPRPRPVTPGLYEHTPGPTRPAWALSLPQTLSFRSPPRPARLLVSVGVDAAARRSLAAEERALVSCKLLVNGEVVVAEEVEVHPWETGGFGDHEQGSWRRLGGPDGVDLPPDADVMLRLRSKPPGILASERWVGLGELVLAEEREVRHGTPTAARPSIVVVRQSERERRADDTWVELTEPLTNRSLADLAGRLVGLGIATAELAERPSWGVDGFETVLEDGAALDRWLGAHASLRCFLALDARASGAESAAERAAEAFRERGTEESTLWVFLVDGDGGDGGDGLMAVVRDPRLEGARLSGGAVSPPQLIDALVQRARGRVRTVLAALDESR